MRMRRRTLITCVLLGLLLGPYGLILLGGLVRGERFFHGLPTSYWGRAVAAWAWCASDRRPWSSLRDWPAGGRSLGWLCPGILLGDADAVPVLHALLHTEDEMVRFYAVDALVALGQRGHAATVVASLEEAAGHEDSRVRDLAVAAAGQFSPQCERAKGILLRALRDADRDVRLSALGAVRASGLKDPDVVAAVRACQSGDYYVRQAAAEALRVVDSNGQAAESARAD